MGERPHQQDQNQLQPRFYGRYRRRRVAGAVHLADLDATVPPEQVVDHVHDEAHFVLVLRGCYLSTARGMPSLCDGLALVYNPPGTAHRDRFATASGRFLTIAMPSGDAWPTADDARGQGGTRRLGIESIVAASRIGAELRDWDPASPLAVESGVAALLEQLSEPAALSLGRPAWLARVLERLHHPSPETPALATLAHEAGVHPVHLSRAFRRFLGCTPGDYLRRQRLALAAQLLARPGRPRLAEVALAAGFFDQSHLHRSLRRSIGLSPSALHRLLDAEG